MMNGWVSSTLLDPVTGAILVPCVFLLAGGLAKKLVCPDGWRFDHFFVGIEATLASISSVIIFMTDLPHSVADNGIYKVDGERMANLGLFLAATFAALLLIMAIHQSWDQRSDRPVARALILGCFCNGVGLGLLAGAVILAKGG